MAEEFDESEVVFSDDFCSLLQPENENRLFAFQEKKKKTNRSKKLETAFLSSLPVNIPRDVYSGKEEEDYQDGGCGGVKIVPPHVLVRRRIQGGEMAFSLCIGSGRTRKGRDLSRLRNSVLKLTGFLEA